MTNFRCNAGHVSSLSFEADELKKPCPECGITIYRFSGVADAEEAQQAVVKEGMVEISLKSKNRRNAAFVGMAGIVLIVFVWVKQTAITPSPTIDAKSVLPVSSAVAEPIPNNIDQVAIQDLKAEITGEEAVMASFLLVNKGGPTNDYPQLRVHWKDSATADLILNKNVYSHPAEPFTQVRVTTELAKPADATGVEITLQYERP